MISQKFKLLSDAQLTSIMMDVGDLERCDAAFDSVESMSDLWLLAKIRETYDEIEK